MNDLVYKYRGKKIPDLTDEERSRWRDAVWREAWNEARDLDFADLKAWKEQLHEHYQSVMDTVREGSCFDEDQTREQAHYFFLKGQAVSSLISWRIYSGGPQLKAPRHERTFEQGVEGTDLVSPELLKHLPPDKRETIEDLETRARAHREFWRRRQDGEEAADILNELAEHYQRSPKAVENWVYPKHPGE